MFARQIPHGPVRMAEWKEEAGHYAVHFGSEKIFRLDGHGDRVLMADTPEFHFGTNQDFSVEAWIRAYPSSSALARKFQVFLHSQPSTTKFVSRWLGIWIGTHSVNNDFGVVCIVSKSLIASTIEATGFEFCLNNGRLACQLAQQPMRPLSFQNFISASPKI